MGVVAKNLHALCAHNFYINLIYTELPHFAVFLRPCSGILTLYRFMVTVQNQHLWCMNTCSMVVCLVYCMNQGRGDSLWMNIFIINNNVLYMQPNAVSWTQRKSMLHDALKGLVYLHQAEPPLVHQDIKSYVACLCNHELFNNILVSINFNF